MLLLFILLTINIAAHAQSQFPNADITSTFTLIGNTGVGCAAKITHTLTNADSTLGVRVDGAQCGANPPLLRAEITNPNIRTGRILQAAKSVPSLIALDESRRACGSSHWYSAGTVTALLSVTPTNYLALAPGLLLPPGVWAVVADPRRIGFCLYTAATAAGTAAAAMGAAGDVASHNDTATTRTDPPSKEMTQSNSSNPNSPKCFPASANAIRPDGTLVRMDQLKVGDKVRSRNNSVTSVFMFTHDDPDPISGFVRIVTSADADLKHVLTLTPEHALYVNGKLSLAKHVVVGDTLISHQGDTVSVLEIHHIVEKGLYNPQTVDGEIIVDGILVSTYTKAVHHNAAHALLAPIRAAFSCFASSSPSSIISTRWHISINNIL